MIDITLNSNSQAVLEGPEIDIIREHFSVKNQAAKFARYRNYFAPSRKYAITPAGRFDIGLIDEINKFIVQSQFNTQIIQ